MSISRIDDYVIIEETVTNDYPEIALRINTLLRDMDADPFIAYQLAASFQTEVSKSTSVSFLSAYQGNITPHSLEGVSLVAWTAPDAAQEHLGPSDFCLPLLIVQKRDAENVYALMEQAIRVSAEVKFRSHELLKEFSEL